MHAEPFEVVVRPGEPADLELAAVAGAGVDLADRERATEEPRDLRGETLADALDLAAATGRLGDDSRAERGSELSEHESAPGWPARLLTELAEHRLGSGQLVVEDPPRHIEEIADERIAHGGLVEVEEGLELLDARLAGAEELEDPDTQRVRQRLEEVGLEGLQIPRWRCAHGTSLYQSIAI